MNSNYPDSPFELKKAYLRIFDLEEIVYLYRAAMDLNSEAIAIADAKSNKIRYVNENGLRFSNIKEDDIRKNPAILHYTELWAMYNLDRHPIPDKELPFSQALLFSKSGCMEVLIRNQANEHIVMARFSPIQNESGQIIAATVVLTEVTHLRAVEHSLMLAQNKYNRISQFIADAFSLVDMQGNFLEFNHGFTSMLGYSVEEFSTKTYYDITPEKWFAMEEDIVKNQIIARGYSDLYEKEYRKKDGTVFPVELRVFLQKDDNNVPIGMWAIVHDITKRKQSEQQLRDSDAKLKKAQEIAQLGSWECFPDQRMLWSEQMYRIFDVAEETFEPSVPTFMNLIHVDDRTSVLEWIHALRGGFPSAEKEFRSIGADDSAKMISARGELLYDPEGRPDRIIGTVQDITERKTSERRLADRTRFSETLVNLIPDILYIYDLKGKNFTYISNASQKMTGVSNEHIKKKGVQFIHQFMHPDDFKKYISEILPSYRHQMDNELVKFQYRIKDKNGQWRWIEASEIVYMRNHENLPQQIFGVAHDITEVKTVQQAQLRTNQDLKALSKCNEVLIRAEDEDVLFGDICRIICDDAGYLFAWVGTIDKSQQDNLVMRTSIGSSVQKCGITSANNNFWQFPARNVLKSRLPYILDTVDTVALESSWKAVASACGICSAAVFPLIDDTATVIGTLSIYSTEHGVFTTEEILLLKELAGDLAYGIQMLRLRKDMEISRKQILEAFREKEILLQELHHRTKNNMQVISSLLEMQTLLSNNAHEKVVFQEMKNRIFAMSLVHEKLYKSKNLSRIDLHEYLSDLVQMLFSSYSQLFGKVDLEINIESVPVTIDIAVPCGLVINELLSNSLKFAFPDNRSGKITMVLKRIGPSNIDLIIKDDGAGKGLPFDSAHLHSLGIPLAISIIKQQLHGTVRLDTSEGFCWYITFRTDMYRERV